MFRRMLIGAAMAGVLALDIPAAAFAQPPSPREILHKADNGVRHALKKTHRAVTHADRRVRHNVRTHVRTVRAMCNDGRIHAGRTRVTACINHGGLHG
jgi:hypothetical protein